MATGSQYKALQNLRQKFFSMQSNVYGMNAYAAANDDDSYQEAKTALASAVPAFEEAVKKLGAQRATFNRAAKKPVSAKNKADHDLLGRIYAVLDKMNGADRTDGGKVYNALLPIMRG